MAATGDGFAGWYRPSARCSWRRVCTASTEQLCWLALLDKRRGAGLFVVLAAAETPDDPPEGVQVWKRLPGRHLLPLPGRRRDETT
jgi:hypothetical protein